MDGASVECGVEVGSGKDVAVAACVVSGAAVVVAGVVLVVVVVMVAAAGNPAGCAALIVGGTGESCGKGSCNTAGHATRQHSQSIPVTSSPN